MKRWVKHGNNLAATYKKISYFDSFLFFFQSTGGLQKRTPYKKSSNKNLIWRLLFKKTQAKTKTMKARKKWRRFIFTKGENVWLRLRTYMTGVGYADDWMDVGMTVKLPKKTHLFIILPIICFEWHWLQSKILLRNCLYWNA